jgi:hypothetical protein
VCSAVRSVLCFFEGFCILNCPERVRGVGGIDGEVHWGGDCQVDSERNRGAFERIQVQVSWAEAAPDCDLPLDNMGGTEVEKCVTQSVVACHKVVVAWACKCVVAKGIFREGAGWAKLEGGVGKWKTQVTGDN